MDKCANVQARGGLSGKPICTVNYINCFFKTNCKHKNDNVSKYFDSPTSSSLSIQV